MILSKFSPRRVSWLLIAFVAYLLCLTVYSYSLIDPNLTLINHPYWELFRNASVQFGYLNRHDAWLTYCVLIILAFFFHSQIQKSVKFSPFILAGIIAGITVFAYPYASHDLFNYIFDARIFTHYGLNPYTHIPGNFADDPWLRFMHWTHRTYPYGPSFLPISIIVSFLSLNKLVLNFLFFKGLFALAYFGSVWSLTKMNRSWGLYFATHPLIIYEGLINAHNDLLAVYFAILAISYLYHSQSRTGSLKARIALIVSAGIKYFTLPTILLQKPRNDTQHLLTYGAYFGVIALIAYVSIASAIQPWYFLNLFLFIPYFMKDLQSFDLIMMGLLLSYFPIIRYGSWDLVSGYDLRIGVIALFCILHISWRIYREFFHLSASKVVEE